MREPAATADLVIAGLKPPPSSSATPFHHLLLLLLLFSLSAAQLWACHRRLTVSSPAMARSAFDFCHCAICSIQQPPLQPCRCFFTHLCPARQWATGWVATGWAVERQQPTKHTREDGWGWWSSYFSQQHYPIPSELLLNMKISNWSIFPLNHGSCDADIPSLKAFTWWALHLTSAAPIRL